jgi:diguanylate cyclase (GGDEF)-like protein
MRVGAEARLIVETLRQVTPGAEIVAVVTGPGNTIPGFELNPLVGSGSEVAWDVIKERVLGQLTFKEPLGSFTCVVDDVEWGVLVDVIELLGGQIIGALIVARPGRAWSQREYALTRAFGGVFSQVATIASREGDLLQQRRLDDLVSQVAERLMSATAENHQEVLDWTMRMVAEFLDADAVFLRRNDHVRGLSILVAEWPIREDIPDPDPLGEVSFDSDPIFMATKDLREPFLPGFEDTDSSYMDRVEKASGETMIAGAGVPLLFGDTTWGILAFIHFELRVWVPAEINALQAVATMLMQLQARIDAEERTAYNAYHDDLTDLPNRRALLRELRARLATHRDTAVLLVDLDRFKVMNDFLGHASGDRLLITIADRIRTSVRANDFVARLGGDEFVVLIDEASSELEILASAYRILELVAGPVSVGGQQVSHTASIGIAMAESGSIQSPLDLLSWADGAMYVAKARGRNQAVVFDEELRAAANERTSLELMLREAIEGNGLRLHYQPEVDLRTGRLLAVEALVRWQHPTRGLIAAAEFIKVAEETGLVMEIGRWVFAEACRQLALWSKEFPTLPIIVRVNMSPVEFAASDLVEFVEHCLRDNDVPANRLCIEITEYAVVDEPEKAAAILRGFQKLGVEVALDDFGTGFASMTELKHLPVDLLKLDMSFVEGITTDDYDRAIVEMIIRLGQALQLGVTAEGIESPDIIEKLLELGCHRGQGYLISRPASVEDLRPMMKAGGVSPTVLGLNRPLLDAGTTQW